MTTDFRALCAELTEALDECQRSCGDQPESPLVWKSRAALAEQPVGPTDEELDEFAVFWWGSDTDKRTVTDVIECCSMAAFARAVLARWGQP